MNRPARFTVAELRRVMKVAEEAGPEWLVEITPDGTIRIARGKAVGFEGFLTAKKRVLVA